MNKKNVATTIVLLLCSCLFMVVGSSFMNFKYEESKIVVDNPKIVASSGVLVWDSKDKEQTALTSLTFSDMSLGLKPVTGESDAETNIPSTVTDKNGSEGLYASFKVSASAGLKIVIKNITIHSEADAEDILQERKNMYVALKDVKNSANSLENNEITLLIEDDAIEETEYTLYFWLSSIAGNNLKGSKISFELHLIV